MSTTPSQIIFPNSQKHNCVVVQGPSSLFLLATSKVCPTDIKQRTSLVHPFRDALGSFPDSVRISRDFPHR